MAYHFYCGQYDKEYAPRRMRNWEVPRWSPSRPRPLAQRPDPKPIATLDGRFLPGVPRGTSGPFGHHVGTWDMPKTITRKVAEELSHQPPEGRFKTWLHPRTQRADIPLKGKKPATTTCVGDGGPPAASKTSPQKFVDESQDLEPERINQPKDLKEVEENEDTRAGTAAEKETYVWKNVKQPTDDQGNGPYIPGSLTEPNQRHESYDLLVQNTVEELHGPQEKIEDKFWRKVAENANVKKQESEPEVQENMRDHHPRNIIRKQDPETKLPSVNQIGYHYARKLHMENLEHQPLPDTLGYRYLTQVGQHRESDIIVKPYAIAWKGYGASGPTSCTKMRVHRPKTSDPKQSDKENIKMRPSTSCLDNKKSMSRMDLAIGWDYRLADPTQEPKPPKHIDGSNGSKAPAVFTMVHTPKHEEDHFPISAHLNPIFTQSCAQDDMAPHQVPYFEKDMSKNRRKDSCEVQNCLQHQQYSRELPRRHGSGSVSRKSSSHSAGSQKSKQCDGIHGCGTPTMVSHRSLEKNEVMSPEKNKQTKEAWINKNERDKREKIKPVEKKRDSLESYEKTSLAQGKLHQSSPDLSQVSQSSKELKERNINGKHKYCTSCNESKPHLDCKPKNDYKFAFKAGNPNSVQSSSSSNGSADSKNLKIPKMRDPYAKKTYSIPTLAPPFCIWRDTSNSGYPEHWRLASVYQHAYKPMEQRRKPLIASVFQ